MVSGREVHPGGLRAVEDILKYIKEDPTREGLKETPRRVIEMYQEMTRGYSLNPKDLFTHFEADGYNSMVLVKDIPLVSLCEHHLLPFLGVAHVGYIPQGRVIGLSKLARIVYIYSRRLTMQERITTQVANCIEENLSKNCMVVLEAEHACMTIRGIQATGSRTVTSAVRGDFLREPEARAEFLALRGSR
jgi:GTP cyclohydrolase I